MSKSILMCRPAHYEVVYEINHWMHTEDAVDPARAHAQWQALHDLYCDELGFSVSLVEPVAGLPDMVFTANGGLVVDGKVALPRFRHPERQGETPCFEAWFREQGYETFLPEHDFEGEGDCLYAGGVLFAGSGYRTDPRSHPELSEFLGVPVVSLRQVDPRFYHLDVAMCPITEEVLMYFPGAFDEASRRALREHFPVRLPKQGGRRCRFRAQRDQRRRERGAERGRVRADPLAARTRLQSDRHGHVGVPQGRGCRQVLYAGVASGGGGLGCHRARTKLRAGVRMIRGAVADVSR